MKKSIKFLSEFGPLFLFLFLFYYHNKNIVLALPPYILTTSVGLLIVWIIEKRISYLSLVSCLVVIIFGIFSIYFKDPKYIYLKPTIMNSLVGIMLFVSKFFLKEPLLKKMLNKNFDLTSKGWEIFTNRWIFFVFFLAFLNELIWRTQSAEFWINFKVFGFAPITIIFVLSQIKIIKKFKKS